MNSTNSAHGRSPHEAHAEVERIVDELVANHARIASIEAQNQRLFARAAELADEIGEVKKSATVTATTVRDILADGPAPDFQEMSRNDVYARIGAELRVSCRTVARWVDHAETLTVEYEATHRTLSNGKISKAHTTVICDAGTIIADPVKRACYEEDVLRHAVVESVNRLREIAQRYAEQYTDLSLNERAAEARKGREVRVQAVDDDQAILTASLPLTEATGMFDRLTRMAWHVWRHNRKARELLNEHIDAATGGDASGGTSHHAPYTPEQIAALELAASDTRTVSQLKADLLIDLVLTGGPSAHEPRAVCAPLAPPSRLTDTDVERHTPRDGDENNTGDENNNTGDKKDTDDWFNAVALTGITAHVQVVIPLFALLPQEQVAKLNDIPGFAALLKTPGMQDPPRIVGAGPINQETARFLAGNSPGWDRILTHPVTGVVECVDRRQPSSSLKRALRARDQHCRFPCCRIPALKCEIDHTVDWAHGGGTTYSNLAHLCPRHHRVKHHTPWRVTQHTGGVMEWVSPGGRTYTDRPPSSVRFVAVDIQPEQPPPF